LGAPDVLEAQDARIREKDKAAQDLEARVASIDVQGRIVAQALGRRSALLHADELAEQD